MKVEVDLRSADGVGQAPACSADVMLFEAASHPPGVCRGRQIARPVLPQGETDLWGRLSARPGRGGAGSLVSAAFTLCAR